MKLRMTRAIAEANEPTQVCGENYIADIEPMPGVKDGSWRVMLYTIDEFDKPLKFVATRPVASEVEGISRARRVIRGLVKRAQQ